jgi:hypothetical protein
MRYSKCQRCGLKCGVKYCSSCKAKVAKMRAAFAEELPSMFVSLGDGAFRRKVLLS